MNGYLPNPSTEKPKTVLTERKIGQYPNSWQTSKICQLFFVVSHNMNIISDKKKVHIMTIRER